jgi:aquaporin rerated protein, other eukaryote
MASTPPPARSRRFHFTPIPPVMGFIPDKHHGHVTAFLAEFCGTFLFLYFAFGIASVANAAAASAVGGLDVMRIFYIATGFGMSVAVNVWLFYRVSGGMLNPAVSWPCVVFLSLRLS